MTSSLLAVENDLSMPVSDSDSAECTAGFSTRMMAFFIDLLVLNIVFWAGVFSGGYKTSQIITDDLELIYQLAVSVPFVLFLGPCFLSLVYFTLLHSLSGCTVGKAVMKIRVVSNSGTPLGFGRSFLRWAGYLLSALPLFAGFLWAVIEIKHRTWHDIITNSKVIYDKTS